MPDNLFDAEERRLLDLSAPSGGVYVALLTVASLDDGTGGTEVSGGAYARQAFVAAAAATDGSSNTTKSNSAKISFPTATANWGIVVAYEIRDAATAGVGRWRIPLPAGQEREVKTGDTYEIAIGALSLKLS